MAPTLKKSPMWTVLLTLLIATTTLAQESYLESTNLTLVFSPPGTCGPLGWNNSISFSTSFHPAPGLGACISLSDVFGSDTNASFGYRNASYSYADNSGEYVHGNVTFSLTGQEYYNAQTNYSSVVYTQFYPSSIPDNAKGKEYFAGRNVYFYHGENCLQGTENDEIVPWYLSNCRTGNVCQPLPFSVASFRIQVPALDDKEWGGDPVGKCVLAAEYGAGSALRPGWGWILMGMVGVGVVNLML